MKTTMKKTAAILMTILMIAQIVPAMGATYSSGMIVGSPKGYKEALDIVASKGTYVLLGQTLELDVNEDYIVDWKSDNEKIATVDKKTGVVTAVAEGTVYIIAETDRQKARVEITVIDPGVLIEEDTAVEENVPAENQQATTEQPEEKKIIVIVINGENERVVYDGEEHLLNSFVATSNEDFFDADKIKVDGEIGVKATNCGTYELKLEDVGFSYDDPTVHAHFVINSGWLKITPASVTVTANELSKAEGTEDPELTATVVGVFGEDTIEYTLTREEGETVGEYMIEVTGNEKQGNYRIKFVAGKFNITSAPTVSVETSVPEGQAVYLGTEITMKAIPSGFGDVELTYQWQWSTDNEHWTDIEGATTKVYTYEITMENAYYFYRVCVNPAD